MKIIYEDFRGDRILELAVALEPSDEGYGGIAEDARALSRANAAAIGRLLAYMVEHQNMPLETAIKISGVYLPEARIE